MHRLPTPQSTSLSRRVTGIVLTLFALSLPVSPAMANPPEPAMQVEPQSSLNSPALPSRAPASPAATGSHLDSQFTLPTKASLTTKAPAHHPAERANASSEPLRIGPGGQVSATYLVGKAQGLTGEVSAVQSEGEMIAAAASSLPACPPAERLGTFKVSSKSIPRGVPAKVTITALGADGKALPYHNLTLEQAFAEPILVTTNEKGAATVELSTGSSEPFRLSDESAEVRPTLLFPLAPGESGLEVIAKDRCGQPLMSEIWATRPNSGGSQAVPTADGLAGFTFSERSAYIDAFGSDMDGIPYYLNDTAKLSADKVTTLVLTGERLSPTAFLGKMDNTYFHSYVVLMPASRKGDGPAYLANTIESGIITPGSYASLWMGNYFGVLQNESLSVKGGTVQGTFKAKDLGLITPQATLNGAPVELRFFFVKRGSFWFGVYADTPISAGKGTLTDITVLDPLGPEVVFGRAQPLSVTIKGGSVTPVAAELAQGEATLKVEPTYDPKTSLPFSWQQRSKDGWSIDLVDVTPSDAFLTDPQTDALYAQSSFVRDGEFYLNSDVPDQLLLTLRRPSTSFSAVNELSATLTKNVYALQTSPEIVSPGSTTTITITPTKNGKPMPNQKITYFIPGARETSPLKTNSKGTTSLKISPKGPTTYEFWWAHGDVVTDGHVYSVPEGWGLVEATATQADGAPIPYINYRGTSGMEGVNFEHSHAHKALMPAGEQTLLVEGTVYDLSGPDSRVIPYLLTTSVTVTSGQTTPISVSAAGAVTLGLNANTNPDEDLWALIRPSVYPYPTWFSPDYYTDPLRMTPDTYDVAVTVVKQGATALSEYALLFPTQTTQGDESLFYDTSLATTELHVAGVDKKGAQASHVQFAVDQGASMRAWLAAKLVRMAPGSYSLSDAELQFASGRNLTSFWFQGSVPVEANEQTAVIGMTLGGELYGSLTAEEASYTRGDSITFTANLVEQQGMNLVAIYTGRAGSLSLVPASLQVKGPTRVSNLPVSNGMATWLTTAKLKAGQYTLSLVQDLKGYFDLPKTQMTITLN